MHRRLRPSVTLVFALLAAATAALAGCATADFMTDSQEFSLTGQVLDGSEAPVAGAEVLVQIGSYPITERFTTDELGRYRIDGVPVDRVLDALDRREELNLLVYSPDEDLAPYGTAEGDRVHLLPLALARRLDPAAVVPGAAVALDRAWVPLQAPGYPIDDDLVRGGGELSWTVPDGMGGDLEITLIVEPGSISGHEVGDEITLTVLDAAHRPMPIPDDGYGVMWTIQPRDVVFEPAARLRLRGNRMAMIGLVPPEVGSEFEVFGASLEQGWHRFGDVAIAAVSERDVTLESTGGIVHHGAWGHVFSDPETDAGVLATCVSSVTGAPMPCAILDDSARFFGVVNPVQYDYNQLHYNLYFSDLEPVCGTCSNNGHPESQLAVALDCGDSCVGRFGKLKAVAMCPGELALTTPEARISAMSGRQAVFGTGEIEDIDDAQQEAYGIGESIEFELVYRAFSYAATIVVPPPTNCP